MVKEKNLLIIECMPRVDDANEGIILNEFIKMTEPDKIHMKRISSKNQLILYLKNKKDLAEFDYVHLSGHGDADEGVFMTPNGNLKPNDFPEDCFFEKTVTLSSCTLGRRNFIEDFMDHTFPRNVIAPRREVAFIDAAIWFVTFYYWALHAGVKPSTAYDYTRKGLEKVRGDYIFWDQ